MKARYFLDLSWALLLKDLSIDPQAILLTARLPPDLFSRPKPALTGEEYFRLWNAVVAHSGLEDFPLRAGQAVAVEGFNPLMFACLRSENLNSALERFAKYKLLLGPLRLTVDVGSKTTTALFDGADSSVEVPGSFLLTELVFLVHMVRLATRARIIPVSVSLPTKNMDVAGYEGFFGVRIQNSRNYSIAFDQSTASRPFVTASSALWSAFEPELEQRLDELSRSETFSDRVRTRLYEGLAAGKSTAAHIAKDIAVSERTLQRKLQDEGTSFKAELAAVRSDLAHRYLLELRRSTAETAFLLGYDEPNSFMRAFQGWTGKTPDQLRKTSPPLT